MTFLIPSPGHKYSHAFLNLVAKLMAQEEVLT